MIYLDEQACPKDAEANRAAQAMMSLHKSLYGHEADIAKLPIEEVNEDLQDVGIDPDALIDRVRAILRSQAKSVPNVRSFPAKSRHPSKQPEGFRLGWTPKLLIVASQAGQPIAEDIRAFLSRYADCVVWIAQGAPQVQSLTFSSLEKSLDMFTNAVIVFSPSDYDNVPSAELVHPSDTLNLVSGLVAGRHGKQSLFVVMPQASLLSEVLGITHYQYRQNRRRRQSRPHASHFNVEPTCKQILVALKSPGSGQLREQQSFHSKFWDVLSSMIVIVFSGHYQEVDGKQRFEVSPHDLEAVQRIMQFLATHYPQKRVLPIPAGTPGWEHLMKADADLILIGGFVHNSEFGKHQAQLEERYRLKMGQLCGINGQRVFRVRGLDGQPLEALPVEIEALESKQVSRDYGLVVSRIANVHQNRRHVISVTGVKGNGTLGAAIALTQEVDATSSLNSLLHASLKEQDTLELVITSHISEGKVNHAEITEVVLNDQGIPLHDQLDWEPCKLGRPCAGCTYGLATEIPVLTSVTDGAAVSPRPLCVVQPQLRRIIFDLDDTLVDTFSSLIMPLEYQAARDMIAAGLSGTSPEQLFPLLMKLRRENPIDIEGTLQKLFPHLNPAVRQARETVFASALVAPLTIKPEIVHLLRSLSKTYELCLLTSGNPDFQHAKLNHLGIRDLFCQIEVLDTRMPAMTDEKIAALAGQQRQATIVVGNRLDHEIKAGNNLGITTVWVRYGEGSAMMPGTETGEPTHTISDIAQLPDLFAQLDQQQASSWSRQSEQSRSASGNRQNNPINKRVETRTISPDSKRRSR